MTGKIYSFIVPNRPALDSPPAKGFEGEYPYATVLVELSEAGGVRIASNMVNCEVKDIKIDMPVEVVFEDITEEIIEVLRESKIHGKPITVCATGGQWTMERVRNLEKFGIPVYQTPERAVRAMAVLHEYNQILKRK